VLPRVAAELRVAIAAGDVAQALEVGLDVRELAVQDGVIDSLAIDHEGHGVSSTPGLYAEIRESGARDDLDAPAPRATIRGMTPHTLLSAVVVAVLIACLSSASFASQDDAKGAAPAAA